MTAVRYPALVAAAGRALAAPPGPALARLGVDAFSASSAETDFEVFSGLSGREREFAEGLLEAHRTLLIAAVAHAISHLDGRESEGSPLLARPQIQADLADIAGEIRESCVPTAGSAAPTEATARGRWARHQRLVAAGRRLLHLLGASSMLATGPGADLHLAELVGNVYLLPGDDDD